MELIIFELSCLLILKDEFHKYKIRFAKDVTCKCISNRLDLCVQHCKPIKAE